MNSGSDEQGMLNDRKECDELLGRFGFKIKTWYSNNPLIGYIAETKKVLGIIWNVQNDTLHIKLPRTILNIFTKRKILPTIAEIWDPLGLCSGITISARLIFQSIVRLKLKWEEVIIDPAICEKWTRCLQEINRCNEVLIPRNLEQQNNIKEKELIGFADGSSVAHGCVLYIRWFNEDESVVDVKFVASKGKLAPIGGQPHPKINYVVRSY